MATIEAISPPGKLARFWDFLLAGRPLLALAAVLIITTGHTMNLREMGVGQGWVAAVFYILQSSYLVSLALMKLACPALAQRFSCRSLAQTGLALAAAGAFLNGAAMWAPFWVFVAGRIVAGIGAGMVIYFAPRLLEPRWQPLVTWAVILLPVAGPGVIGFATMFYDVSDWEWGFLVEGGMTLAALVLLLSMGHTHEARPPAPRGSLAYLPTLALACAALVYCLHWGQLQGWMESLDIVTASAVCAAGLIASLWLAWPYLHFAALKRHWIHLLLVFFGGACQFFHGYTMNTYGGSLINFSSWQRAWLIWPMPIGIAAALALTHSRWGRRLASGLPGAVVGLLLLAVGLYLSYERTLEWPFWQVRDLADLNWFSAPSHWELAPGRFLMGLGVGLFMFTGETLDSLDAKREESVTVKPFLPVVQFLGGGLATGAFVNFLLIGHLVHYSYSADREYIQASEFADRQAHLSAELRRAGQPSPDRAAEVLLYRFVNYEAENLVFATIYAAFFAVSLLLAGVCLLVWIWTRLRKWMELPAPT